MIELLFGLLQCHVRYFWTSRSLHDSKDKGRCRSPFSAQLISSWMCYQRSPANGGLVANVRRCRLRVTTCAMEVWLAPLGTTAGIAAAIYLATIPSAFPADVLTPRLFVVWILADAAASTAARPQEWTQAPQPTPF